jgi:hypothetical protein
MTTKAASPIDATHLPRVREIFARIDAQDPDCLTPYLAPDGIVTFANQQPLRGIEAVREGCTAFFSAIAGLHHEIVGLWAVEGATVVKLRVTYTRHDGGVVTIPVVTLMETADGGELISEYSVYFDLSPVFA